MELKFIHSKSIFVQLVVFSLMISLVPILIISVFLFQKLDNMVVDEMMDYHEQISSQYTQNIEEKLTQYQRSLEYISDNTVILDTLVDAVQNPYNKGMVISEEVSKSLLLERQSEIRNCMIYSMQDQYPVYGNSVSMMTEASREVWFLKERAMNEGWFSYFTLDKSYPVLSFVKNIEKLDTANLGREQLGIVKLDVNLRRLFTPAELEGESAASYDIIVYDPRGEIYYSTDNEKNNMLDKYQSNKNDQDENTMEEIETYVVKEADLDPYGLKILFLFDNNDLLQRKQEIQGMVFPIIVFFTILVVIFTYIYSADLSSRIAVLVNKFRKAETGNLIPEKAISGKDEIAVLDQQFSHMLKKLDELIKKNYIQQLENKETQLKNLQLQINPHFLYNTLETISSIAAVKQAFVVCDMCGKLGEIFRYSLGKDYGEFVTLEQELKHTKNYIFIQEIRYGNQFEVFYNIEVDEKKCKIPRFILQPIVENAIMHGWKDLTGKGALEISIYEEDRTLVIAVADDGVGMDPEKVELLNAYINNTDKISDNKKSIGIRNVNQRIKLMCGSKYGITIKSYPYQGSCVTLLLPVYKEG